MEPQRWQRVKDLFDAALKRAPSERRAFLDRACTGDRALGDEVLSLLQSFEQADSFIEPAAANTADVPTEESHTVPVLGRRLGSYQLIREIAEGGMGTVYLATRADQEYQKRVAVKVIRATLDREAVVQRFRQERQMLAALTHPHIVTLLDGGTTEDGLPFLVMDYVEGVPIDAYCDAQRLSTTERLRLFLGVCAAVQYAHQNLVVHRDLKPSNILVTPEGVPKLLDFGIAKLLKPEFSPHPAVVTRTTERPMTLEYASPEQIRGESITTATDVYALGVVLYQVLTGHSPYRVRTDTPFELQRAICEVEPEKPSTAVTRRPEPEAPTERPLTPESVSRTREGQPDRLRRRLAGDLDTIVLMALRKEPQRRYASVEQLAEDLRRHLENQPVLARRSTWRYRAGKFTRRHAAGVIAAALVVLTLVGGVIATTWQARVARAEKTRAERRFNDVRRLANSFMFEVHDAIQNLAGSTPARRLVVNKAREYLDGLSQEAANDTTLQAELAEAYLKVGDVEGYPYFPNLGDPVGALDSYRKALGIAETVARSDPPSTRARWLVARSHERVAAALMQRGDGAEAMNSFRQALAIYESLSAGDRGNTQLRLDLARCYDTMGDALGNPSFLSQQDTAAALDSYRKSLAIYEEVAAANPTNLRARRGVAVGSTKIGDMLAEVFDMGPALESYRTALVMFKALAEADPTNADRRRNVQTIYGRLAVNLAVAGNLAEAIASAEQALSFSEASAAADPANALAQRDLAVDLKNLGDLQAQHGDVRKAHDTYLRLLSIIERLSADDPSNLQRRSELAETLIGIGQLQAKTGRLQQMRQSTARGLSILKAQADGPDVGPAELSTYASALLTCEPPELRIPSTALRYAQRAVEKTNAQDPGILMTLAQAYAQVGNRARAIDTARTALKLLPVSLPGRPVSGLRRELEERIAEWGRTRRPEKQSQ